LVPLNDWFGELLSCPSPTSKRASDGRGIYWVGSDENWKLCCRDGAGVLFGVGSRPSERLSPDPRDRDANGYIPGLDVPEFARRFSCKRCLKSITLRGVLGGRPGGDMSPPMWAGEREWFAKAW